MSKSCYKGVCLYNGIRILGYPIEGRLYIRVRKYTAALFTDPCFGIRVVWDDNDTQHLLTALGDVCEISGDNAKKIAKVQDFPLNELCIELSIV